MTKSIQHRIFYPHAPEVVWDYLTKADLMKQWLMPNDFEPILGYDFQFKTNPIPSMDFDGIFYCKVVEIVPFQRLSYSMKGGPGEGKISLDSIVNWKLQPKDNGTELSLEHNGFKELENFAIFNGMNEGWLKNMQKIAKLING